LIGKGGRENMSFFCHLGAKYWLGAIYVHLRREGLDGYISDFNNMVKEVWGVTGDIGIEILPFVPVVHEGLDEMGRDLIGGVKEWVRWIAEKSGRSAFEKLAETGGRECEQERTGSKVVWRPTFMLQHGRQGGWDVLSARGNTLTLMKGERRESEFERVLPAKEIGRMERPTRVGEEMVREKKEREDFGKGISVEGEFAFTRALGDFCRASVKEGTYKGNYRFNLKGQMENRAMEDAEKGKMDKVSVVFVGGSQMGRLKDEIERMGEKSVVVQKMVRVQGAVTTATVDKALAELAVLEGYPEFIVVGGPGNSIMEHGTGENRGFGPERTVKVKDTRDGRGEKWEVRYHMENPRKITLLEKRELVDKMVTLTEGAGELFPEAEVVYVSTFPRHVDRCCGKIGHMTDADTWAVDSVRRDVDRDVKEVVSEGRRNIRFLEWWDLLGLEGDANVTDIRRMGIVDDDGVHLTARACRNAAVVLCNRLNEIERVETGEEGVDDMVGPREKKRSRT
jgi:hypothetical protein